MSTRRIGIDARLYFQTGVGTYLRNFLFYLQNITPSNIQFYVYVLKKDSNKIQFENSQFIKREVDYKWHTFGEQIGFLNVLNKDKLDLMHFTYFSSPILYKRPFISTIHDVTPLLFSTGKASTKNKYLYALKHFFFKIVLNNQVRNSLQIITPTKTVKKQLINIYGKNIEDKIIPVYEGINRELIESKENSNLTNLYKSSFFIYVGNFYPHKNVEKLVRAFSKIKTETKLILIGPDDFFTKKLSELIKTLCMNDKIVFYHNAETQDLKFFYQNALALIHPSLSEGFGLPIIEARYFQCPIIASNIPVFQELLVDRYVQFDPMNEDSIQNAINSFLKLNHKKNDEKISSKFSFEEMTRNVLTLYLKNFD
ncbi:MAG: glycosyltransferase family 1 protein [bacterium]|nr:glycosyltransferase family 1 protein [bacterium]